MGGVVGELILVEASLGALLVDIRKAISDHGPIVPGRRALESATTGQLVADLLAVTEPDLALFPPDLRAWFEAVKGMVEQRNFVVHAIGQDRCIKCGASSVFAHRDQVVDRSPGRVRQLIVECQNLLDEGVGLAAELSHRLNQRLVSEASERARETGQPQAPAQIKIAGISHQCASCHPTGSAVTIVAAPAASLVMPPGMDGRALFIGLGDADQAD